MERPNEWPAPDNDLMVCNATVCLFNIAFRCTTKPGGSFKTGLTPNTKLCAHYTERQSHDSQGNN